jgi:hypothetical protein
VRPGELHADCCTAWEARKREEDLRDIVDLTEGEKDFLTLWNQFLSEEVMDGLILWRITLKQVLAGAARRHLPDILAAFVWRKAEELGHRTLYRQVSFVINSHFSC